MEGIDKAYEISKKGLLCALKDRCDIGKENVGGNVLDSMDFGVFCMSCNNIQKIYKSMRGGNFTHECKK